MLTRLANGNAVDLAKATQIYADNQQNSWHVIIGSSAHFGKCDTFEAACKERDRLIEIADNSPKPYALIKDRYHRSSDVRQVTTCGWDGSNWFIVAHVRNAANDGTHSIAINCESEEQGNALAREIMEQVAASE